jgi:hypothetical protein
MKAMRELCESYAKTMWTESEEQRGAVKTHRGILLCRSQTIEGFSWGPKVLLLKVVVYVQLETKTPKLNHRKNGREPPSEPTEAHLCQRHEPFRQC